MTEVTTNTAYFTEKPVALVIGCGNMGMACARALGQRSPLVLVDINDEYLQQCVAALRVEGYTAEGVQCDITDAAQLEALGKNLAQGPGVRTLAHVAAIAAASISWRKVLEVDLIGAVLVAQVVMPRIVRGGAAVFISSTGSYHCPPDEALLDLLDDPLQPEFLQKISDVMGHEPDYLEAYFIAKQGVNRLARRLALEWGPREVRAVSVSPGLIDSTMGRTGGAQIPVFDDKGNKKIGSRDEKAAREVPLRRQGSVLEVSAVVDFLASDAASFINGIDVPVDGGSTAYRRDRGIIKVF